MQKVGHWKRFHSKLRGRLDDVTVYEQSSLYGLGRQITLAALKSAKPPQYRRDDPLKRCARAVAQLRKKNVRDTPHLLALLLLQTPGAARAQREMDAHRGGYKNRQARLFELIDFNDTFVDLVLSLNDEDRVGFTDRLQGEMHYLCDHLGVKPFDEKQFTAIVHGLSREIAVYTGAKKLGYITRMTSRVQDSKGVDMIITDPETKKSLGVDIKTRSSFHFRLLDLKRQNRIDEEQRLECELAGFCTIEGRPAAGVSETILLRIATKDLGPIAHYVFEDLVLLDEHLQRAFRDHGRYIVGMH